MPPIETDPPPAPQPDRVGGLFRRAFMARPGEVAAMLWSALYHFFVLFSYFMLRPVRESMGIERGYENLAWLMTGTMAAMFLASPLFAALVSRMPRRKFIPLTYRIFALTMIVFYVLFRTLSEDSRVGLGYAVYIWLSVFNLFVVSVFWAFMADIFNQEQGKRLFGFIAVGGTLGALAGPIATGALVGGFGISESITIKLQPYEMLLVSCVCLELAVQCVKRLLRLAGMNATAHTSSSALRRGTEPGPGFLEGLRLLAQSPYLMLIAAFMLVFTVLSSLLYMEQGRIVEQTFTDRAARTAAFAQLDVYTQSLTLLLQLFLTSRIIRMLGIGGTLSIVPLLTIAGFAALILRDSFAVLAVFMVLRRAFHYALDRPAREILYTVVSADAKYKSKSFIDTFIYRGGDVIGGWMERLLTYMSVTVGIFAIPLAMAGFVMALALGKIQRTQSPSPPA